MFSTETYWDTLMAYVDAANLIYDRTGDRLVFEDERYCAVVDELYRLTGWDEEEPVADEDWVNNW